MADHGFGKGLRLRQKKPVVIGLGHLLAQWVQQGVRGHNVHQGDRGDGLGFVQAQPMRHPSTAIMPCHGKALKPQMLHEGHLITGHMGKAIGLNAGGFPTVTVAAQIRANHPIGMRQNWRNLSP